MYRYGPCPRCGDTFATNQKFKYHLTERKHPCASWSILQTTVQISSSKPLSNSDSQLQVVKDSNARKSDQPKNLAECKALYDELLQMNEKLETRDYVSPEAGPEEEINETIKLAVDAYRAFENEDEAIQGLFLQCLYCNYLEKEINKTIKLA
ncbi:11345_t:CDS:2, partial [Dentiscutata heterogama]